ncbi:PRC-barrel domain-containing protein [Arthrobacter sp. JSM 101049]|uniref:PRC-barrel domain-containing protein n=1 Tax=Arthrobacter sp. JSM 101049 TaxID=929097 RepID=UPI00356B57E1
MILSDLLGSEVRDAQGQKVGLVSDVRFVLDGPVAGSGSIAGARLVGLVVGRHRASSFMGYERRGVNRPWPLAGILGRRDRASFLALWSDIESMRPGHVVLRAGFTRHDASL